jgi:hypothetical protein
VDGSIFVTWTPSAHATGYKIYYSPVPFTGGALPATFQQFDGGRTAGVYLAGLTNGVTYFVAVAAIAQAGYYCTITAFSPGTSNESRFAQEVVQPVGPVMESPTSTVASSTPAVQPISTGGFGDLGGGGGCFIATAAYGWYSAPQVQLLRDFRDRVLLTNGPGRAFVAWYYRYGPYGAAFINDHPWSKPFVRLLLLPLLGGALFILHGSLAVKCFVLGGLLLLSATRVMGKSGGRRRG